MPACRTFAIGGLFGLILVALDAVPAAAWGPATHVFAGLFVIHHLELIGTALAALVADHTLDFLHGSIAADRLVGKGSRPRPDHCHNWSTGDALLARATTLPARAFAWGYLAHLAADVVAHNFFVPTQHFLTGSRGRWGHGWWEAAGERQLDPRLWGVVRAALRHRNPHHDRLLAAVWSRRRLVGVRGRVYTTSVRLMGLPGWQRVLVGLDAAIPWQLEDKYVALIQNTTLGAVLDLFQHGRQSAVRAFDPVGSANLAAAPGARRRGPAANPYRIPEPIYRLRVGRDTRAEYDRSLDCWLGSAGRLALPGRG